MDEYLDYILDTILGPKEPRTLTQGTTTHYPPKSPNATPGFTDPGNMDEWNKNNSWLYQPPIYDSTRYPHSELPRVGPREPSQDPGDVNDWIRNNPQYFNPPQPR